MNQLQVITAKVLASSMGISVSSANRYLKDIKEEYDCKKVLGHHIKKYFKIDAKSA